MIRKTLLYIRARRWLMIAIPLAVVTLVASVALAIIAMQPGCESWSDELTAAMDDGSFLDGSFEPSPACAEQMRRDLDRTQD